MILQALPASVCQRSHEKHRVPRIAFSLPHLCRTKMLVLTGSHNGILNGYDVLAWQDASGRTRIWTQVARGPIQDQFSFYLKRDA